ncbi:MAG: hypothetical protein H0X29_01835 [Parachlamydiaceae bacterium]|nr:hypothetical protein [Parachlamydiaceae bacterium]
MPKSVTSPMYQPVVYNVAVYVSKKNAKNKANQETRNAKIKTLKEIIKEHVTIEKLGESNKKFYLCLKILGTGVCIAGIMSLVDTLKWASKNSGTLDKGSINEAMGRSFLLGALISITAYIAYSVLDSLSEIFPSQTDNNLIETEGFHKFVIDRCKITASSADIESLKNLYYNELDALNGL